MGGFHWYELAILAIVGLLVFGPKRLPDIGSAVGKTIREFQKSMREVTNPEPPSSIPPSAAQPAQVVAPASIPAIAPGATPASEPVRTPEAPAVVAVTEAATPPEASADTHVEEDAVR
jgi:sec-independent protein translocase protein TatA